MSRSKELILLAQRIRALSQTGLVYSLSEYDTERYEELSRLSDEITALATGLKPDDVASGYRPAQEYVTPKVDTRLFFSAPIPTFTKDFLMSSCLI